MKIMLRNIFDFEQLHEEGKEVAVQSNFALVAFPSPNAHRPIHFYTTKADTDASHGFDIQPYTAGEKKTPRDATKEEHQAMVKHALAAIESGGLKKVVVSRTKQMPIKKTMHDWLHVYGKLCEAHSKAMVYWFKENDTMWMGATPELLLKKNDTHYETMSLAGTQTHHAGEPLENVKWTDKDLHEQHLVTEYIVEKLHAIGAFDVQKNGPHTSPAGQLVHLKTNIQFQYTGTTDSLLQALHPTPAVCGMPVEQAKKFIEKEEPHARAFYTGYLGAMHENNQAEYYVNLRCMQIGHDTVTLYAGGGIVIGSEAEKEWEETERKMETLMKQL
jgi:isochorismate synthase